MKENKRAEKDLMENRHLVFDWSNQEFLVHLDVGGCAGVLAHSVNEHVVLAQLACNLVNWNSSHVARE